MELKFTNCDKTQIDYLDARAIKSDSYCCDEIKLMLDDGHRRLADLENYVSGEFHRNLVEDILFENSLGAKLLLRRSGRPKRLIRRLMFHKNGKPRGVFRKWILDDHGYPYRVFRKWMMSPEYQRLPKAVVLIAHPQSQPLKITGPEQQESSRQVAVHPEPEMIVKHVHNISPSSEQEEVIISRRAQYFLERLNNTKNRIVI